MVDTKIDKILVDVLTDGDINLLNTEKLLDIIIDEIYIKNQFHLVSASTQELAKKLIAMIKSQANIVRENFRILHLLFGLSILLKLAPVETIKDQYYYLLSTFSNINEFHNQFRLVARSVGFKNFAVGTAKYFFDDEFYHKMELKEQQKSIYIYFYSSTQYNKSSRDHINYMYQELYKVFLKAIELKQSDLVFYLYMPLLYSHNSIATTQDELKIFNDKVETKLSEYIKKVMIPLYKLKPNNQAQKKDKNSKIKVAFIQERMYNYSIHNVFKRLLKSIQKSKNDKYEFVVLDINFAEFDSDVEEAKKISELGFKYVDLHSVFTKQRSPFYSIVSKTIATRQYIIDEGFDIIIGGNGRAEFNFLYTIRTAPKQMFWSHGNFEYNVPCIDKYISHFNNKNNNSDFQIFNIARDISEYNPGEDIELTNKIRARFPSGTFILGTIGRLIKINSDEYLESVAKVMKQNPNTVYLACGTGSQYEIEEKIKKLGIFDRFYFEGQVDPNIYGYVIDLWLDTFPLEQGESLNEYMFKDKLFVRLAPYELNNEFVSKSKYKKYMLDHGYIEKYKILGYTSEDIIDNLYNKDMPTSYLRLANNIDEYIKLSNLLIQNENIYKKLIIATKMINNYIKNYPQIDSFMSLIGEICAE